MGWNLKGGVLIIGSLLWQDYLNKPGDAIRKNWRNAYLDSTNKIAVRVPIRYGRKSSSGIMTMVFSNRMQRKCGFGYVVPFKKKINNIEELLCHSIALSAAEGMKGNFVRPWGVLTYLFNDSMIDENIKKEVAKLFRTRKNDNFDIKDYKVKGERSCITKSLKLDIRWVEPLTIQDRQELNKIHLLLATATKPMDKVPTFQEIANTIKDDTDRKYFINNITNGIITYDDFEIAKLL